MSGARNHLVIGRQALYDARDSVSKEIIVRTLRPLLFPLPLILAACGTAIPGHYTLQTYNDEPPPFDVGGSEMTAVDLQLNDDGTCSVTATTESGIVTIDTEEGCSWSASGGVITVLSESDNMSATGSLIDGTLTLTGNRDVYVFVKR